MDGDIVIFEENIPSERFNHKHHKHNHPEQLCIDLQLTFPLRPQVHRTKDYLATAWLPLVSRETFAFLDQQVVA